MRYQRLQKSLEGGLAGRSTATTIPTPKKAGTKRKRSGPAKASAMIKKRKMGNDDSVVASDSDIDPTTGNDELTKDNDKRSTRGIKIDYSELLAYLEAPSEKSSSEDVSDTETSMYEDSRPKHQTPSRVIQSIEQTPPPTEKSVKQVSVSPQMTVDDENAAESSIYFTPRPARIAKKMKSKERSTVPNDDPTDDVRDELDALRCGQRVSESMFKKRKHNQVHSALDSLPVPQPCTSPNLRRFQDGGRPQKPNGADGELLELDLIGDSISPDDSISMAGEAVVEQDKEKTAKGRSFLRRVSQFWKLK